MDTTRKSKWGKERRRTWKNVYRHLGFFLIKALDKLEGDFVNEDGLRRILREDTGFGFQKKTLHNCLKKLETEYGDSPLEPVYIIHRDWFRRHRLKIPQIYLKLIGDSDPLSKLEILSPTENDWQPTRYLKWMRHYRRLIRHPERYLPQIFEDTSQADLRTITYTIAKQAEGVVFKKKNIDMAVKIYNRRITDGKLDAPLIQEDPEHPGIYRRVGK